MDKAWYKDWFGTPYYAMLYGNRDDAEAQEQVEGIIALTGSRPGSRVLDMACGRGRHARCFLSKGMEVTGFDVNPTAIEVARGVAPKADFRIHDMREHFAEARFDLVVNLFTSFGYFDQRDDDLKVLRVAHAALKPGGSLLIDFMNTPRVLAGLVEQEERTVGEVRFTVTRRLRGGMVEKSIHVRDGGCDHRFTERVMALLPQEIVLMAAECGFDVHGQFGGFDGSPYDVDRSDSYVLWAKRVNG